MTLFSDPFYGYALCYGMPPLTLAILLSWVISWFFVNGNEISKPKPHSKLGAGVLVALTPFLVGGITVTLAIINDDGLGYLIFANALGGVLVAAGAVTELVARVLEERDAAKHKEWHNFGLGLLAFGGVFLALKPILDLRLLPL